MERYEYWLQIADDEGLHVIENVPFKSKAKGMVYGKCIALSQDLETTAEKTCTLVEEIIHSRINVGNILDQRNTSSAKQEHTTRKTLHNELADLRSITSLLKQGYRQSYEIAEKLGVTEEFLYAAIACYQQKYGSYVTIDGDTLLLEPTVALLSQMQ